MYIKTKRYTSAKIKICKEKVRINSGPGGGKCAHAHWIRRTPQGGAACFKFNHVLACLNFSFPQPPQCACPRCFRVASALLPFLCWLLFCISFWLPPLMLFKMASNRSKTPLGANMIDLGPQLHPPNGAKMQIFRGPRGYLC